MERRTQRKQRCCRPRQEHRSCQWLSQPRRLVPSSPCVEGLVEHVHFGFVTNAQSVCRCCAKKQKKTLYQSSCSHSQQWCLRCGLHRTPEQRLNPWGST